MKQFIKAVLFDLLETLITELNNTKLSSLNISERLAVPHNEYEANAGY